MSQFKKKSLEERMQETEFGFLSTPNFGAESVCLKVDYQYAIHLIKNEFNQKALVANIHFESAGQMDALGQQRFINLFSELNHFKSLYGCDDLVIGGDLNVALITGPQSATQTDKAYQDKITEIRNNIEVIQKLLAEQNEMSFRVSLPSKAIKKVRMPGDITINNQASVKFGETITDSQIVIQGSSSTVSDHNLVFYRGETVLQDIRDPHHCIDADPIVFELVDKDRCFDHQILSTNGEFNHKFSKLLFVNALETTQKGPKGIVENRFKVPVDPAITRAWTQDVISFALDAAACVNPENKNQEIKKSVLRTADQAQAFLINFLDKFYESEKSQEIIDKIKDKFKQNIVREAIEGVLSAKITKSFKKNEPCCIYKLISAVGQEFTQSTPGGFVQTPRYFEMLEALGAEGLTAFIESQQENKLKRLSEAENGPVSIFLTECQKDSELFSKVAKEEMRIGLLDLSDPEEAMQYKEIIEAFKESGYVNNGFSVSQDGFFFGVMIVPGYHTRRADSRIEVEELTQAESPDTLNKNCAQSSPH